MSQTSVIKTSAGKLGSRRKRSIPAKRKKGTLVPGKKGIETEDIFGVFDRDPEALEKVLSLSFHEAKRKAVQENQAAGTGDAR